jgi:H+-transporting ATPase
MMYLKVSLSDFLTLFSARTHNGFFWSSRPSWMLLTGACISMGISTIIACFWPANVATFWTDGIPCRGLAIGSYRLWALWVWFYCIFWWWVQDVCKVGAYWLMHRFNVFEINSAALVNVRATTTFGDKNSLARMSAGMVEGKLLEKQIDRAAETVSKLAESGKPEMRRASQDLQMVRNSVRVARQSLGQAGPGTADAPSAAEALRRMAATVAQIEAVAKLAPEADRAQIAAQLEAVRQTAERMAAIDRQMRTEQPKH